MNFELKVKKLKEIIEDKGNALIYCADDEDYTIIKSILTTFDVKNESILTVFTAKNASFPFVVRIGSGEIKDVIPHEELVGLNLHYNIYGFTEDTLIKGESWRWYGLYERHYDWTVEQWQEYFKENPKFKLSSSKCHRCNKNFDNDGLYAGFFKTKDALEKSGYFFICKECAYRISKSVRDYDVLPDGTVKFKKWRKDEK